MWSCEYVVFGDKNDSTPTMRSRHRRFSAVTRGVTTHAAHLDNILHDVARGEGAREEVEVGDERGVVLELEDAEEVLVGVDGDVEELHHLEEWEETTDVCIGSSHSSRGQRRKMTQTSHCSSHSSSRGQRRKMAPTSASEKGGGGRMRSHLCGYRL